MKPKRTLLPDPAGLWGLTIFIVLAAVAGNKALKDGDTLWHIKMGQVMLERGELLTRDIFSHTAYGQPWHAHEWLSEVVMAILYDISGLPGVTIVYFAIFSLAVTLIFKIAGRLAGEGPSSVAVALALPCMYIHLLARPHVFTWLGASLTLYLLERDGRWPWLLIPITAVWANLHAGVLFGLTLQAVFIAGKLFDIIQAQPSRWRGDGWMELRQPFVLLGLCLLAACLNPFGYQLFLFPFKVAVPIFTQQISEWRSPDFQELWFAKPWIVGIVFMAIWIGRKLSWRWNLLMLFLFWQTLSHVRNLSIAALLLVPCFAMLFQDLFSYLQWRRETNQTRMELSLSPWSGPLVIILLTTTALVAAGGADLFGLRSRIQEHFTPPKNDMPAVVEFLKAGYPHGNLLNEYEWGDYLLYAFDTPPKVFIDGRADMYGEKIFSDYKKIVGLDKDTDRLLDQYDIGWVLFPEDHILVRYLRDCKNWQTVFKGSTDVVLVKPSEEIGLKPL